MQGGIDPEVHPSSQYMGSPTSGDQEQSPGRAPAPRHCPPAAWMIGLSAAVPAPLVQWAQCNSEALPMRAKLPSRNHCSRSHKSNGITPSATSLALSGPDMCVHAITRCDSACRAIQLVRQHSRGPIGLDAREYLIRVERRLVAMTCPIPFNTQSAAHCPLTADRTVVRGLPCPAIPPRRWRRGWHQGRSRRRARAVGRAGGRCRTAPR